MNGKIGASHLARQALVYVRQSSMAQVWENTESTSRQYGLVARATALGWREDDVVVIDEDLGRSGASTKARGGFAKLAEEVAQGRVGMVLALEVSRLARSSSDWQQLLRLCRVADVLVADESAVYDPSQTDDRLLLDLKGTMSEAELQWLALRLAGARRSRARRGELAFVPATGYVWEGRQFTKDPDAAIQAAIQTVFSRFEVEPSAWAVVTWARRTGFELPTRVHATGGYSEVRWGPMGYTRLASMLHNPIYAGVYAYGRSSTREVLVDREPRRVRVKEPDPSAWTARIRDAHPGYITWEQYVANQEKLHDNANQFGGHVRGAAREGAALLSGIMVCGQCGRRMRPGYGPLGSVRYQCHGERATGGPTCWSLEGEPVDRVVEDLFLETMVPKELELVLAVAREATGQADALAAQWRLRIERAEYEARLAERRYMAVDPDNRVVARTLEAGWEQSLRDLERLRLAYEDVRRERRVELTEDDQARIRALATDLPAVWRSTTTHQEERQAMLRLVVEAVCLTPVDAPVRQTRVVVQWRSGDVTERFVARPGRGDARRTPPQVVRRLRALVAEGLRDEEVAVRLNAEGLLPAQDRPWTTSAASQARRRYHIPRVAPDLPRVANTPSPDRFPNGTYSVAGLARELAVSTNVVRGWIQKGRVSGELGPTESGRRAWHLSVDEADLARLAKEPGRRAPRKAPLPDQFPDGRWSVPGLARRFLTHRATVRGWMVRGIVQVEYQAYGDYPRAAWIHLDEDATKRLEELARRRQNRTITNTR